MSDHDKIISDFESENWTIGPQVKSMLHELTISQLLTKIAHWQDWRKCNGKIEIGEMK